MSADLAQEESWEWAVRFRVLADARPFLMDVVATFVLDLITIVPLLGHENRWWVYLIDQALLLPLVFRRRWPSGVFAVVCAVAFIQWLSNVPLAADAALLAALYTMAAHESRARALFAAATIEVGSVLASIRFAPADESALYSLIFLTGMVTAAFFGGTTVRTRRAYLATVVESAQQRERTRIAREMHDIVAHNVSVMIALSDGAAASVRREPEQAREVMTTVSAAGRQALGEMRRLLGVLRDDTSPTGRSPQPGLAEIESLADRLRMVGPDVEVSVDGTPRELPPTEDATAYRIVQESLTNVVKHGIGVTKVVVSMSWYDDALRLRVSNDGAARDSSPSSFGHGLIGMIERASVFDGTVSAGPLPGGGWTVEALLPIGSE